jgi:hypothetical protein
LQLPETLAPTFRGKALRFAYELSLSLNIASSGYGASAKQKIHEVTVPIRVFPSVNGERYLFDRAGRVSNRI